MYHENFSKSAGTSYRRVAVSYSALSVVIGDKERLGGSDMCLHFQGET